MTESLTGSAIKGSVSFTAVAIKAKTFCLFRGKGRDRIDRQALEPRVRASQMPKTNTIPPPHTHTHKHTAHSHEKSPLSNRAATQRPPLGVTQECVESRGFNKRDSMKQYGFYVSLSELCSIELQNNTLDPSL